jgi:hypothetical protein
LPSPLYKLQYANWRFRTPKSSAEKLCKIPERDQGCGIIHIKPAILYSGAKNSGKTACEVAIGQCFCDVSKLKSPKHYVLSFDGVSAETVRFTCGSPKGTVVKNFVLKMDEVEAANDIRLLKMSFDLYQRVEAYLNQIAARKDASVITIDALKNVNRMNERATRFKRNYPMDKSTFKDGTFWEHRNNLSEFLFFKAYSLARDAVQCSSYFTTRDQTDELTDTTESVKMPFFGTERIEQTINIVLNPIARLVKKKPEYTCMVYSSKLPPLFRPMETFNVTGTFGQDGQVRITPYMKLKPILLPRLKMYRKLKTPKVNLI